MSSICIVTPDIIGPVTNGGIGTHCYFLAVSLMRNSHNVHILFTGPFEKQDASYWRQWYSQKGIIFDSILPATDEGVPIVASSYEQQSLCVYEYLKTSAYDQIHFQDWQANGFHCIQAKRTLGRFARTRLIVTLHSNTEWINQGMEVWPARPAENVRLQYCERYCAQHADTVVTPSRHMREWVLNEGWSLSEDIRHLPYILLNDSGQPQRSPTYMPEQGVLAFFGRLETRKGLHLFCQSVLHLSKKVQTCIRRILFLGKDGICNGQKGTVYIKKILTPLKIPYEIHTTLDSFQAQKFLHEHRALVFCPSLLDNLPYAILECVCHGFPVLGAATGGIPEILPPQHCFPATIIDLTHRLAEILTQGYQPAAPRYNPFIAEEGWCTLAEEIFPQRMKVTSISETFPKISVCIPHYNHGAYLPDTLKALATSDYPNFEIIVTDDGSTDDSSRAVFEGLADSALDQRFRFYRKNNEGLALCRNFCATKAKGELLAFVDSDNLALPNMLSTFARAICQSGVDALSCHYLAFSQNHTGIDIPPPLYRYAPSGPALIVGLVENVFGDANLVVRKTVFDKIHGFMPTRQAFEDWEFLIRLSLAGYTQDVIPEPLFSYRHCRQSMSRTYSQYKGRQLVLSAYREALGPLGMAMAEQLLLPLYMNPQSGPTAGGSVIIAGALRMGEKMERLYQRLFPTGSRRQRIMTQLRRKVHQR